MDNLKDKNVYPFGQSFFEELTADGTYFSGQREISAARKVFDFLSNPDLDFSIQDFIDELTALEAAAEAIDEAKTEAAHLAHLELLRREGRK